MGSHSKADDVSPTAETPESGAIEETVESAPQHNFFTRLYTGTGAFNVVGRRRLWFAVSGLMIAIAIASIAIRGFTWGIDFEGGTKVSFPRGEVTVEQAESVFHTTLGEDPEQVVVVGTGSTARIQIRSETLNIEETARLKDALAEELNLPGQQAVSDSAVSSTWGGQITQKALIALVVFLVLVTLYITVRYERYMAIAALAAMFFDVITTAGLYSLVGWEVSPATVIGLLTILGFSLYDTVIVFDKVEENTHGFQHTTRRTFAEHANLAVNQTFMRSINTSLISVLPIAALMVVAVWLLGVGTLKDLALVQLVGVVVGTYSSVFFATPLLVTLRERTELVRTHTRRVMRRRKPAASADVSEEPTSPAEATEEPSSKEPVAVASKPAPGVRPTRPGNRSGRPAGKRNTRRR